MCGKCLAMSEEDTRKVDKRDLELCVERVNELLRERMLEIVQENPHPTLQLKHILTLQDQLMRMVAGIGNGVSQREIAAQFGKLVEHVQPMMKSE